MKEMIIILATVVLGIYIGVTLINGDSNSLAVGAKSIVDEANDRIESLTEITIDE